MTRAAARRRKRRIREAQRIFAWTVLCLFEILLAAAPTAIVAAIALPLAYSERGHFAIGGEWLMILIVFCGAYFQIHNWICDKIFEEG